MQKIILIATMILLSSGLAFGKSNFAKEVGLKCAECHVKGMKGKTKENLKASPLFAKASEMVKKMKGQKEQFKGKKSCNDCHAGARVPAPKS